MDTQSRNLQKPSPVKPSHGTRREEAKRQGKKHLAKRQTERETKETAYTRREIERMATERKECHSLIGGLCSQQANRHK